MLYRRITGWRFGGVLALEAPLLLQAVLSERSGRSWVPSASFREGKIRAGRCADCGILFEVWVCGVLQGFLKKMGGFVWCFDGQFVVRCVVKMVS
jgi:hypothetical protein